MDTAANMERLKDFDWMRQSFLLAPSDITRRDMINRVTSTADFRFADTTVGGSPAINMPYQFTRYADLKTGLQYKGFIKQNSSMFEARTNDNGVLESPDIPSSRVGKRIGDTVGEIYENFEEARDAMAGNMGMGRYYQESIERNSVLVHMRFGVPEYNSMVRFFGNFYSHQASQLANRGRGESKDWFNRPGQSLHDSLTELSGSLGTITGQILILPFYPFIAAGKFFRSLADTPSSKFYYLKSTMALYRSSAGVILNSIAVNMGISPYAPDSNTFNNYDTGAGPDGKGGIDSPEYISAFSKILPDIFNEDGFIDVTAMTTRYQRKANRLNDAIRRIQGESLWIPWSRLRDNMNTFFSSSNFKPWRGKSDTIAGYMQRYLEQNEMLDASSAGYYESFDESGSGSGNGSFDAPEDGSAKSTKPAGSASVEMLDAEGSGRDKYVRGEFDGTGYGSGAGKAFSYLEAEWNDGGQFMTFRVENPGSMSESFSNQTRESDLAQKINSASASARSARFDFADGNVGIPGLKTVIDSVTSFVGNALDQVKLSGLLALSGNAFVDIPKVWDNSSANLPRADFTIKLRSAYGNPYSRFLDLYVPLSFLLAGALPLSTGMQSYTSPFICECYSTNRVAIRLGMIESMSINRAVANLPFAEDGGPMGIDVTFTVVDLSTVMFMPIVTNVGLIGRLASGATAAAGNAIDTLGGNGDAVADGIDKFRAAVSASTWGEDNVFTDYMAVLGGLSLNQLVYGTRRVQLQIARQRQQLRQWRSPSDMMGWLSDSTPGRIMRAFAQPGEQDLKVGR